MKPIRFVSEIAGLEEIMPIIKSSELNHAWKSRAAKDADSDPRRSVSRCPGINSAQREGWVVRLWQDVTVSWGPEEGGHISWESSYDQSSSETPPVVTFHSKELFHQYRDNWPINACKEVLKFNTGWVALVPKGYKLLQLPVLLSDDNRFTVVEGLYELGSPAELNIPVYWNTKGVTTIKAGTPLAQLILIPDTEYEHTVEAMSYKVQKELRLLRKVLGASFITSYSKIRKLWATRNEN